MTGTITRVNNGNGAYDVAYMHGGNDRKVPNNLVRPKDKSDTWLEKSMLQHLQLLSCNTHQYTTCTSMQVFSFVIV